MSDPSQIRIAVLWLYVVAAATLPNSLLLQLSSRFVDLLAGLWFTQATDAIFFGMRTVEPQGASPLFEILLALIVDALVVLLVVVLAVNISRRSRRAAATSLIIYVVDTAVFAVIFGSSVRSHVETIFLWEPALTFLAHVAGTVIIFRAWRALRTQSQTLARV
jgi:hypothetical protein